MPRRNRRREYSGCESESLTANVLDDESNSHYTPHRYADMCLQNELGSPPFAFRGKRRGREAEFPGGRGAIKQPSVAVQDSKKG